MKPSLLIYGLILCTIGCKQPVAVNPDITSISFYSTGRVKQILSLNSDSAKNGVCYYFDEYGYLDSSVTYLNGKLNGLRQLYYPDYGIYSYEYKDDTLIRHRMYDTLNILKYETPLDIKKLSRTEYRLRSGKSFFNQDIGDTITIINKGLPDFNRGLSISGALFFPLNDTSRIIRVSKHQNDLKEIKIVISIYQHLGDTTEIPTIFDTIIIPVK